MSNNKLAIFGGVPTIDFISTPIQLETKKLSRQWRLLKAANFPSFLVLGHRIFLEDQKFNNSKKIVATFLESNMP